MYLRLRHLPLIEFVLPAAQVSHAICGGRILMFPDDKGSHTL
jgi:hypothetical protein